MIMNTQIEQALAPVEHEGRQMIDARRLHEWLGHRTDQFQKWMQGRIEDYGFVEGSDFSSNRIKTKGRPRIDYLLTVNMAKELAMVERSKIGQMTRRYFIEMEQAALTMVKDHIAQGTPEATPQVFFDAMKQQQEINQAILTQLKELSAAKGDNVIAMPDPKSPPVLTKEYYSSKQIVGMFGLAGPSPTGKAFTSTSIKTGQKLSMLSRIKGVDTRKDCTNEYPITLYHRDVIAELVGKAA